MTVTLKDLTWDNHKKAETTALMKSLLKNQISETLYSQYLYVQYEIYANIESRIKFETQGLNRAQLSLDDWQNTSQRIPSNLPALDKYTERLRTVDPHQLWAHVYLHYLAPLYGGQIIKRVIGQRFPTSRLDFDNPEACKMEIRPRLTVDLADEANQAFESIIEIYDQLYQSHQQHS